MEKSLKASKFGGAYLRSHVNYPRIQRFLSGYIAVQLPLNSQPHIVRSPVTASGCQINTGCRGIPPSFSPS